MEEIEKKVARTMWNYLPWPILAAMAAILFQSEPATFCTCTSYRASAWRHDKHKSLWESTWLGFSDEVQTTRCCLETTEMSDSDDETPTDHQLKFVLLGDGASGKVSFLDKVLKTPRLMESYSWCRKSTVHIRILSALIVVIFIF